MKRGHNCPRDRSWSAREGSRVRSLTGDGLPLYLAKRIARAEFSKRRALAQIIGEKAARSGQLVVSFNVIDGDFADIRFKFTIEDGAIRDDSDRLALALAFRAGI